MPSLPLRTGQQLPLPKLQSGLELPQSGLNFRAAVLSKIKISLISILLVRVLVGMVFFFLQHAGGLGCQPKASQT